VSSAELENLAHIGKLKHEPPAARRVLSAIEALPEAGVPG
jgi:hypothetical protein